jgi:hypothetical protein
MRFAIAGSTIVAFVGLWLVAPGCGGAPPPAETGADEMQDSGPDEKEAAWCCCNVCREEFFARKGGDTSGEFLGCLVSESWETQADCEAYGRGCIDKPQDECSGY